MKLTKAKAETLPIEIGGLIVVLTWAVAGHLGPSLGPAHLTSQARRLPVSPSGDRKRSACGG